MLGLIADYIEHGFLENVIDMFKHDRGLYPLIGDLIADKRGRVRIGTAVLIEELKRVSEDEVIKVIPYIAKNLRDQNPTIRGDSAYVLGIIGHRDALPFLRDALDDEDQRVKQMVEESIDSIEGRGIGG